MDKFIPKEKLSKKEIKKLNNKKRVVWSGVSPVTRKPKSKKAYDRKKARQINKDLNEPFSLCKIYERAFI